MKPFIRITDPTAGPDEPRRLNSFPGRYLSEREFELLQAYVDDRITPLVRSLPPGIISGMEVQTEGSGSNTILRIQSGTAVGAGGRLVRLVYPIRQEWPAFAALMDRQLDGKLRDGLYFLTLHGVVEEIDNALAQDPCTRTEPDPLRDRRLETVVLPSLQFISANPRWLAMSPTRAANRVAVRYLNESPHQQASGAIPVALVKITNKLPDWIDAVAGRYLSEPNAAYRTLLTQTVGVLEDWLQSHSNADPNRSLAAQLGLDYLPAAGPLPFALLQDAASKYPKLMFQPMDLQVELSPVPASTLGSVIDHELPRGVVDLVHGLGDRIRLLLAIPDLDYRPTLMDLPARDLVLEDALFQREQIASTAWRDWWLQWQLLFGGLSTDLLKQHQAPRLVNRPLDPAQYRNDLVEQRRKQLANESDPLPEPYSSHLLAPHGVSGYSPVPTPAAPAEQLLRQRETIRDQIHSLEQDLDESYQLLNEMNDYLNLQRQQLDSLTISFSALAGGVAGDGSGSSMMRWNGSVVFDPTNIEIAKK